MNFAQLIVFLSNLTLLTRGDWRGRCISACNFAVDNHTVYTPTLYYHDIGSEIIV